MPRFLACGIGEVLVEDKEEHHEGNLKESRMENAGLENRKLLRQ